MNLKKVVAIAQKDLLEVAQNRAAWVPMVIVPLIFIIIFPLVSIVIPMQVEGAMKSMLNDTDTAFFIERLPASMLAMVQGMDPFQSMVVIMLGFLFAPMFLIFPLMFASIIAAESFAGEKERKTLEALLYTATTDRELFLGKVLAGFIPALCISWGSFLVYTIVVNVVGYPVFGRIWFPLSTWYPLIFWISPALAVIGVSATVLISARAQTFMGAYQTSGSLVVLVLALLFGQVSGVLYLTVGVGLLLGLVLWGVAALLTWLAVQSFNRTRLLSGTGK